MSFQTMNNPKMSQRNSSHSPRQQLTPNGAQEPQHQVQAPAPPTNSEKVQDSVPEGTRENTEGSHPCDAEELKQQEESREDPCGDSAMNNNAALNDNARRTNEVEPDNSLLTPREE